MLEMQAIRVFRRILLPGRKNIYLTTATVATSSSLDGIMCLEMPKLSPTMETGRIVKWHVPLGTKVNAYDLLLEISATKLVCDGDEADTAMDIEIMEDGVLVQILHQAGDSVAVGKPIAVFCDNAQNVANATKLTISDTELPVALWQAYVKEDAAAGRCL